MMEFTRVTYDILMQLCQCQSLLGNWHWKLGGSCWIDPSAVACNVGRRLEFNVFIIFIFIYRYALFIVSGTKSIHEIKSYMS
jgi:hypothetical protein